MAFWAILILSRVSVGGALRKTKKLVILKEAKDLLFSSPASAPSLLHGLRNWLDAPQQKYITPDT